MSEFLIEAIRRLQIPEDLRKKPGFALLGAADGETKTKVFGQNAAPLFNLEQSRKIAWAGDALSERKLAYQAMGGRRRAG
jgi:uncharacterized protein